MNNSSRPANTFCVVVLIAIILLSLAPQFHLWVIRGSQWNGAYAGIQGDEFLYSGYINALLHGRSRRNDPFAGRDSTPTSPVPESTFSIQFIPSYLITSIGRVFGVSSATLFIASLAIGGALAGLAVMFLMITITSNRLLSALGMLFVLTFGALSAGQGLVGLLFKSDVLFLGLPFLRRYQPVVAFPLFFVFCAWLWKSLITTRQRHAYIYSLLSGLSLAVLIFSYLYLWTTALAWLVLVAVIWLVARFEIERFSSWQPFAIVAALALLALVPYSNFVSHRARELDEAQTMIFTRWPDLFRPSELIGVAVFVVVLLAIRRGVIERTDPRAIFAACFALLPLVVFNQQVLTGRTMQPYHFEVFIVNYAALIGLVIVAVILWEPKIRRSLTWIAIASCLWGATEVTMDILAHTRSSVGADHVVPVLRRLDQLSAQDGTLDGLRSTGKTPAIIFSPQREVMAWAPTWTSQATLLNMGGLDFGTATQSERKESFYMYLYYSDVDAQGLRNLLRGDAGDFFTGHYARIAIFGHEHVLPILGSSFQRIQPNEIEEQVRIFDDYLKDLSREKVLAHPISYVVTTTNTSTLEAIDRWYERDAGEQYGDYTLYRVKLRS
jgi:hypothetical protein